MIIVEVTDDIDSNFSDCNLKYKVAIIKNPLLSNKINGESSFDNFTLTLGQNELLLPDIPAFVLEHNFNDG